MRITVLFILTISWHRSGIRTQQCGKPEVSRVAVHIYRRVEEFKVKVNRCLFNDTKHAYSDITENCMRSFKTGIFKDKLNRDNHLKERGSPVVLEDYITIADMIRNEIKLRSGAVCRYDRGFCYDPSETVNYAVVWNVIYKPLQVCPTRLELVFSGLVDIWNFQQGRLKYLVYYSEGGDRAFYLKIVKKAHCDNKNILITEGNRFIISQLNLDSYSVSTTSLSQIFPFSLDSKKKVAEAIMKNCDLQQYPLDFTNRIGEEYLKESKNLKTILEYYQELIIGVKIDADKYLNRKGSGEISKAWNTIFRNLTNLESLVNIKVNEINEIHNILKNLQQTVASTNTIGGLNKTMTIIQELQLEDRRVSEKIDDEHDALQNLEKKFAELDIFVRKEISIYPTRMEFNKELSSIQREINSKLQVFMSKLDSVLKDNFTHLKNDDSKFQRDIADRYDKSLEKLESDFEDLSQLLENVKNQLASKINVTNNEIISNFTLIKHNLAKIEHDIPEIQSVLEQWNNTDINFAKLEKDLLNHKNNFSNIIKIGEEYMKNIQTNISSTHLISLDNKYNISEMKNRFEKLLIKLSDIDWNVVKALKPDSISEEECRNEIIKFQRQYDKKVEVLSDNLTLALNQYKVGWSLQYSNLKTEIRENIDSLLAEMKSDNSENTNELIRGLNKRIDSELTDIKQSTLENVNTLSSDLKDMKFNISNITKIILEKQNGTYVDITNIKTELSKCKLDSIESVKFGEEKLRDIQKNTTDINNTVIHFGKDISEIREHITEINKGLFNVENNLNTKTSEYLEGIKKSFHDIANQTDVQLNMIKQLTFRNLSLMKSELNSIQQDLLINHKPIFARVEDIDIAAKNLKQEFNDHQKNSTLNLGVIKNELKNIRDIVVETKNRSINNEGKISELKFDLDTITSELKVIQETSLENTLNIKTFNESLNLQEEGMSNILLQLVHFRDVINEIKSKDMNIEKKLLNFEQAVEQIDEKLLKTIGVPDKIDKHATEIDHLNNQVKTIGTNMMNEVVKNKETFSVIKKNISDIFVTLKDKENDTSDLKTKIQGFFAKFNENKKFVEESKVDCLNYVNSRMSSVTEEITQIHNLLLKKGEEIRKVEAQISEKSSTCCEETRKELNEKDALIKQLTVNLDKVMKQVRNNDERLAQINKVIEDNLNGVVPSEA